MPRSDTLLKCIFLGKTSLVACLFFQLSSLNVQAVQVTCVGDSITYGYGVSQSYPTQLQALYNARAGAGSYTVGNFGINSQTLRDDGDRPYTANAAYASSLASSPDYVVIMLGANDAKIGINWNVPSKDLGSTSIDIYTSDYASLINSYRTLPSSPHIFVCTPVPERSVGSGTNFGISGDVLTNEMSPALRSTISAASDVSLIELNATFPHDNASYYLGGDKIHPSATGYAFISETIYNAIATKINPTWNNNPSNGETNVTSPLLNWTPSSEAVSYQIYVGTNLLSLSNATTSSTEYQGAAATTSFTPTLNNDTSYFWRIDTVTASATITGSVWSFTTGTQLIPAKTISIDFSQGGAQLHTGGQMIGPLKSDSQHWNEAVGATGTLNSLTDEAGNPTTVNLQWSSSNTWANNDGTANDEQKLAVGYLDDNWSVPLVTISNIPYSAYRIYGLFASDLSPCGMVNVNVNGSWALGGDVSTTASAWGSISSNFTNNAEYWTRTNLGVTQGNYWTVDSTGSSCSIQAEPRNDLYRASLTGLIIEQLPDNDADGIPDSSDPDDDDDTIPDSWEITHSLNPLLVDATSDADHDGYSNLFEYHADTDPQNRQSAQALSAQRQAGSSDHTISFNSSASRLYTVQYSDNLDSETWLNLTPAFPVTGTGVNMEFVDPSSASYERRFYRLQITLP